jgi:hypothetical protein
MSANMQLLIKDQNIRIMRYIFKSYTFNAAEYVEQRLEHRANDPASHMIVEWDLKIAHSNSALIFSTTWDTDK